MKSLFINFLIVGLLVSQSRIGDWKAYTSPLHINDLTEYNNLIICATNGGILLYDKYQSSFSTLTVVDQLKGTAINVIEVGKDSLLWLGGTSPNGFVQIYDVNRYQSIAQFDFGLT